MLSDDEPLLEKTKSFGSIGQNKYLIEENVEDEKNKSMPLCCLSDPVWDLLDPLPDIRLLFSSFDSQFFGSSLGSVEVKWSSRMTLCAGVCKFQRRHGICSISLSEPLLKFRPRKDLVETLLHEMIHAFLFVTRRDKDRDDHGPNFKSHMHRINSLAGLNITVYHSFHDEVDTYRTHWWRCTGPCRYRPPYFGYVKRSMNRAPGPKDAWWAQHQATCMGKFIKIKEPKRNVPLKRKTTFESHFKDQAKSKKQVKSGDIRNFITINSQNKNCISESASQPSTSRSSYSSIHIWPSDDKGHILGNRHQDITSTEYRPNIIETVDLSEVSCPNCACIVLLSQINEHLDICLS
ncbi:SprT-like domain-containing protein Spartan [Schistosoma japonicum]|nr:SprT-like domain-containing protein Spartan [Schistosoma japonicum]